MRLKLESAETFITPCRARLPFRFGFATMTWAPLVTLRATVRLEGGGRAQGLSSELLVPHWFDKRPERGFRQNVEDLLASVRAACGVCSAPDLPTLSMFDLWRHAFRALVVERADGSLPLVAGFGVSLVERAVMDAACRSAELSFARALREDLFGFEPGRVHPELEHWRFADSLSAEPLTTTIVRHTVGLADALDATERPAAERVNDGLPETLVEDIERYGLECFKVKVSGRRGLDRKRILRVAEIFMEHVDSVAGLRITLDGNEQYTDLRELVGLLEELRMDERGKFFMDALSYVEQPLPRGMSLDPARTKDLQRLTAIVPCIIDEADVALDSFPRAIDCGYAGVSVKNCKGVFRALLNRGLCDMRGGGDARLFQTAEDLTCLPVVSLQQSLATTAALGLTDVERNGHHYFRGLDHLPGSEARSALAVHPDLYEERDGLVQLRIHAGRISLGSLEGTGYGYGSEIALDHRTPLADWRFAGA